jgi:hypothetical protein
MAVAITATDRHGPGSKETSCMRALRHLVLVIAVLGTLDGGPADAASCTDQIDQTEALFRSLDSFGHQSLSALRHRQPTPATVAQAQRDAVADREHHRKALERARAAEASGDLAGCLRALDEARHAPAEGRSGRN